MTAAAALALLLAAAAPAGAVAVPDFYQEASRIERAAAEGRREEALKRLSALAIPAPMSLSETVSVRLRRAELGASLGEFAGAEADIRAALAASPRDYEALCVLTQFLRERSRLAESLEAANILAQVTEGIAEINRAEKWLQRGETLMRLERFDEAEADIARALSDKPEDVPSLWLMTQALMRRGAPHRALPFASRMVAAAAPGLEKARALAQRGQVKEALDDAAGADADMLAALEQSSEEHVALEARMQRLRAQGRVGEALKLSDAMIAASSGAPPTRRAILHGQRAYTRRLSGDAKGAEEDLREALRAEPDSAASLSALTELLLDLDRAPDALAPADRLILAVDKGSSSGRADAYVLRSRVQSALGRAREAAADLERASRAAPDSAAVFKARARAARAEGRAAEALALASRFVELSTGASAETLAEALIERALALADLGRRTEAEADLEAAARLSADSSVPRMTLAMLALADGGKAAAEKRVKEFLAAPAGAASGPDALRRLDASAAMLLQLGEFERALSFAESLVAASSAAAPGERAAARARRTEIFEHLIADLVRRGKAERALPFAERFVAVSSAAAAGERASALVRRAAVSEALGRTAAASADLAAAAALAPRPGPETAALIEAFLRLSRPERALPFADRVVVLTAGAAPAERSEALERRARVLQALGRFEEALSDLAAASAAAPAAAAPRLLAAHLLAKLGRGAEAMKAADDLVAVSTRSSPADAAKALSWRAERRAGGSDFAGAEADHAAAEAALPGYHSRAPDEGVRWAAAVFRRSPPEALALLARLRAHAAAGGRARAALAAAEAEARWTAGDAAGAAALMAEAVRRDAKAACVGTPLLSDRSSAADGYFDACVSRFPKDPSLRTDRGVARWGRGDRAGARSDFRAALAAAPGFLPAAMSLSAALEFSGSKSEAAAVLRGALESADPAADPAPAARRELERLTKR